MCADAHQLVHSRDRKTRTSDSPETGVDENSAPNPDIGNAQATAAISQNFQLKSTRNRLPSSLSSDVAERSLMPSTT